MMRFRRRIIFLFHIIINISIGEGHRILAIFPYNAKSHDMMFSPIMVELAKRNHQVDIITHFPVKNAPSNYKVVVNLNGTLPKMVNSMNFDFVSKVGHVVYAASTVYGNSLCELMAIDEIQEIVRNPPNDPPYDLVITEAFAAHCYMGFGFLLKVPVVAIVSTEYPWITELIGNNENLAFVPNTLLSEFDKSNFFDRLKNVCYYYWNTYRFQILTEKVQTDLMRKYLSPDIPSIREVEKHVALFLVNSHPVTHATRPSMPSVIEVSGLHIKHENMKISSKLRHWMNESVDGVVYFTFGSMVLIESLPKSTLNAIFKSLSKISPVRVLMKIADDRKLPLNLPTNVLTSSWIPQQAVLAHKNTRAFITHGGLMGCQETLYFGVPIIGIPLFGDQPRIVATFATKNMGIMLDINKLTFSSLDTALSAVLTDPMYRDNAKMYSKLFKDRPLSPMNTAIFWIDYVIRHRQNIKILKSPALDMHWWQLALLDVYGFLFLNLTLALSLLYYFTKFLLRKCLSVHRRKVKIQ